jgi:hypothetical protein
MRALIEEPDSGRFRISQEGLPVVDEQLNFVSGNSTSFNVFDDHIYVSGLPHTDNNELFNYRIDFDHFKITQSAGSDSQGYQETLIINPIDSLYLESS